MPFFNTIPCRFGTRISIAALLSISLAACSGQTPLEKLLSAEPSYMQAKDDKAFARELRQRYLELSSNAHDRGDKARSDFYGLRALMANEGKLVRPAELQSARMTDEQSKALGKLRSMFGRGIRRTDPENAARAQAGLDCWISEMGRTGDAATAGACRSTALVAINAIEAGKPAVSTKTVSSAATVPLATIPAAAPPVMEVAQYRPTAAMVQPVPVPAAPPPSQRVMQRAMQPPAVSRAIPSYEYGSLDNLAPSVGNNYRVAALQVGQGQTHFLPVERVHYSDESPGQHKGGGIPVPQPVYHASANKAGQSNKDARRNGWEASSRVGIAKASTQTSLDNRSIYFGLDSADITPGAEAVLMELVKRIDASNVSDVILRGFTDSSGGAEYNQILAMRRTHAVRRFLKARSSRNLSFEMMPIGELAAVTKGGDGIVEARNRKVDVYLR